MSNSSRINLGPWNGQVRRCLDCDETKPLDNFPPAKRRLDGRGSYCRPCMNRRSLASADKRRAAAGLATPVRRTVPEGQKWCPDCETFKDLSDFGRNRSSSAGLTA